MPVTADSSLTADSGCWTADGRIICISAEVAEPIGIPVTASTTLYTADNTTWPTAAGGVVGGASDSLDAVAVAGGAVIAADAIEAAAALDTFDAAVIADTTVDNVDAVIVFATAVAEAADALDQLDAVAVPAGVLLADVAEAAGALDALDATVEAVEVPVDGGGAYYPPLQRPFPVVGRGYGILPRLEGEAHGVVGAVAKGAAQLLVRANAIGACGQAGHAAVTLKGMTVGGKGAVGARGVGSGVIMKFSGSATGQLDEDEAAVIAFLLAA